MEGNSGSAPRRSHPGGGSGGMSQALIGCRVAAPLPKLLSLCKLAGRDQALQLQARVSSRTRAPAALAAAAAGAG